MKLPISVIVPLSEHRSPFFYRFTLPSIEANCPTEIIIEEGDAKAPIKRNRGADRATQPFLFFCDDDAILAVDCLTKMHDTIAESHAQFSYCNYFGVVSDEKAHPLKKNFVFLAEPFNYEVLKKHNYIDTMSLVKTDAFPGFDEALEGYQDWDLWLSIAEKGGKGVYIEDVLYMTFNFGGGISSNIDNLKLARKHVLEKHQLQP